jgi:hypothetical protein
MMTPDPARAFDGQMCQKALHVLGAERFQGFIGAEE